MSFTSGLVFKTMRKTLLNILLLIILFFCGRTVAYCEESKTEIKNYEVTVTVLDKHADVDVLMEITYSIPEGKRLDDFKDLGYQRPTMLIGNDERGLIPIQQIRKKGYKIAWVISPQDLEEKTIIIRFKLLDALSSREKVNVLDLPWIGTFNVPVQHAIYRVIFPVGFQPEFQEGTSAYKAFQDNFGRTTLTVEGKYPGVPESLKVVFSPLIVEVSPYFRAIKQFLEFYRVEIVIIFVVILFLVSTFAARKFNQ